MFTLSQEWFIWIEHMISIPTFEGTTPVISVNNWIVFQQKFNSSVSFTRGWLNYTTGFGSYNGCYWMGLEKVYQLMKSRSCRARIEILNDLNQWLSMEYDSFYLDDGGADYTLHVSGYSGDMKNDTLNCMAHSGGWLHNGLPFTTIDRDHDRYVGNCATWYGGGGWWWNKCHCISLNGDPSTVGFAYNDYNASTNTQHWRQLKTSRMMLKCYWLV